MFLALKEIIKEKSRYILIIMVTVLISYLIYFLSGLAFGLAKANVTSIEYWNTSGIVLSKEANNNIYASRIEEDDYKKMKSNYKQIDFLLSSVSINESSDLNDMVIMGINKKDKVIAAPLTKGRFIENRNEIVVSEVFAKKTSFEIGDTIRITSGNKKLEIVGICESSSYNTVAVGYIDINDSEQIKNNTSEILKNAGLPNNINLDIPITFSAFLVENGEVSAEDLADYNLQYLTYDEFIDNIPGYSAQLLTFGLMIISLILISSFVIGIFLYILTMQKKNTFGILKIQGISNSFIVKSVVYQTLIISVIGVVLGLLLTLITFNYLPSAVPVELDYTISALVTFLIVLLSLLGSLFSAKSILKVDPIDSI